MKINSLINERVKTGSSTKMSTMAERSASGNMTTFAGLFSVTELSVQEKESLESILSSFASDSS
ncbi:MAG: CT583 family protein, partial [Parachlamydiaceae bacterium]